MPLAAGSRVGAYEIKDLLGSGGMGEVYRAHDPRLGREVAIKVLPPGITNDPERVRRFEQEARAAAALSHPNILAVYDIGQTASTDSPSAAAFIVMELLPGETLRELTRSSPLPVRKAIDIAIQVANGLAAAHDKGVIHRDLKPENIFVTTAGLVKILDFGLAKLTEASAVPSGDSASTRQADTRPGVVMGTAGYMSPEQVRGGVVDHRTDIFAFGAVLYELLSGARAFRGETSADLMMAILKEHPPDLPAAERHIPLVLTRLVDRCLEKSASARFQSAGDLAFALQSVSSHSGTMETAAAATAAPTRSDRRWLVSAGLGVALVGALAYIAFQRAPADAGPRTATVFPLTLPEGWAVTLRQTGGGASLAPIAISPDGTRIVVAATGPGNVRKLILRSRDGLTMRPLEGTDGASSPFWSPDSQQVGFFANGKLLKINTSGGSPFTICDAVSPIGGTWSQHGVILFGVNRPGTGLQRVAHTGGAVSSATVMSPNENLHSRPYFLPDGRHFLFRSISPGLQARGPIFVGALDSGDRPRLMEADSTNIVYSAGHLLFLKQSTLMAQRFDPDQRTLAGDAFAVAEPIQTLANVPVGVFSASLNGVLVYQTGSSQIGTQLAWFNINGTPIGPVGDRGLLSDLRLSPDGTRATVSKRDEATPDRRSDIWIVDTKTGLPTRFTFDPGDELTTVWSADSKQIVFNSDKKGRQNLYQKSADGSGDETELYADDSDKGPVDYSPDGKYLLYLGRGSARAATAPPGGGARGAVNRQRLWVLPLTGERKPVPVTPSETDLQIPGSFSPDGRWIVFAATEQVAPPEVYVVPFPSRAGRWQISKGGGSLPRWNRDGIIYFTVPGPPTMLTAARVEFSGPAIKVIEVKPLGPILPAGNRNTFSVAPDGKRVLVNSPGSTLASTLSPPTVVIDWPLSGKR
jgi:Tol biopolymer transport system component